MHPDEMLTFPAWWVIRLGAYLQPTDQVVFLAVAVSVLEPSPAAAPDGEASGPVAIRQLMAYTGLARQSVRLALQTLVAVGALRFLADNDKTRNLGAYYSLVYDPDLVDWTTLDQRRSARKTTDRRRTATARQDAATKRARASQGD